MDSAVETEPPPPPSPPPSPPPPPLSANISAPLPLLQQTKPSPVFMASNSPPSLAAVVIPAKTFTITTTKPLIPQATITPRPVQSDSVPLIFLPMPPQPLPLPPITSPSLIAQSSSTFSSTPSTSASVPAFASASASESPATATTTTTSTITAPIKTNLHSETSTPSLATNQETKKDKQQKKSVLFSTVTVYYFTRSQGFISIPTQGGSTLGMKRRHFLRRKLSVDMHEEVRRRSRRQIILKIRFDKDRRENNNCKQMHYNSTSSSTSSTSSTSNTTTSDSDDDEEEGDESSYSDSSDISDSELESRHVTKIFVQPMDVKLRRSLLRASGVGRIDPKEKKECKVIRESRDRSGCKCVNQCLPGICECISLGVNCHVDRDSFPCGCISTGCQNPQGRTEFDYKRVRGHSFEKLMRAGIG